MNRYSSWFDVGPLGCGRTTAIAKACKSINATMLCATSNHAKEVANEHGIKTASIQNVDHGYRGPFLADHYAIQSITHDYEAMIAERNIEISALKLRINRQSSLIDRYREQRDTYKKTYLKSLEIKDEYDKLKKQVCCSCCGSILETGECARCE